LCALAVGGGGGGLGVGWQCKQRGHWLGGVARRRVKLSLAVSPLYALDIVGLGPALEAEWP
jgi:hypothetical protein